MIQNAQLPVRRLLRVMSQMLFYGVWSTLSDIGAQRFSQGRGRCLLRFQQQLHIMQRVHEAGETLRA